MTQEPPKKKSRRGGRRPGAPKGNLNALQHGRRSRQFARLGYLIAADPGIRNSLTALGARFEGRRHRAQVVTVETLSRIIEHARNIARGIDSPGPFRAYLKKPPAGAQPVGPEDLDAALRLSAELKSMNDVLSNLTGRKTPPAVSGSAARKPKTHRKHPPHNQPPNLNPPNNQTADTKTGPETND